LAAGADDGTILFVQAADTNAFSDVAITMTGDDTATYADGDGMPIVWYDNDGAFAEVGVLLQAGGAATTLLTLCLSTCKCVINSLSHWQS
jgi:hypothetical protein